MGTREHIKRGRQIWSYDGDFDAIEAKFPTKDYRVNAEDGKILVYKCHIVLEQEHFYTGPGKFPNDSTREIVSQFLHDNDFPFKTAPKSQVKNNWDIHDLSGNYQEQVGKCFTIYYPTLEHFYIMAKGIKELIAKYNLKGIPKEYFEKHNLNMQYEYPVPETNVVLYYTLANIGDEIEGTGVIMEYLGGDPELYAQRRVEMNKYFGQGPLDFLFPKLNPSGEAFW